MFPDRVKGALLATASLVIFKSWGLEIPWWVVFVPAGLWVLSIPMCMFWGLTLLWFYSGTPKRPDAPLPPNPNARTGEEAAGAH